MRSMHGMNHTTCTNERKEGESKVIGNGRDDTHDESSVFFLHFPSDLMHVCCLEFIIIGRWCNRLFDKVSQTPNEKTNLELLAMFRDLEFHADADVTGCDSPSPQSTNSFFFVPSSTLLPSIWNSIARNHHQSELNEMKNYCRFSHFVTVVPHSSHSVPTVKVSSRLMMGKMPRLCCTAAPQRNQNDITPVFFYMGEKFC